MASTRTDRVPVPERVFEQPGLMQEMLSEAIRATARDGTVRLLEAGCGQRWDIAVPGVTLKITGVDLDADAMQLRLEREGDLEEWIVGDLRTVSLPPGQFDIVYCSYLLEHVAGAEQVLDRLIAALRPGGRLLVRVPDGDSVYGWAAKHAPFRLQVAYKRWIEGNPDAGKPGHAPYPVVYDPVVSLDGLRRYAQARGLRVVAEAGSNTYVTHVFKRAAPIAQAALNSVAAVSRGRLTATHNNLAVVLEVPGD
jgi:SAM-dependent methyltransferase